MLRRKRKDIFQGLFPVGKDLPRQAEHQIHRKIPEAPSTDSVYRIHRLLIGVDSAQHMQNFVIIALNAKADPVKAFPAQLPQKGIVNGVRVGFKGNFCPGGYIEMLANGI